MAAAIASSKPKGSAGRLPPRKFSAITGVLFWIASTIRATTGSNRIINRGMVEYLQF
jgi:hypothetical protein